MKTFFFLNLKKSKKLFYFNHNLNLLILAGTSCVKCDGIKGGAGQCLTCLTSTSFCLTCKDSTHYTENGVCKDPTTCTL